jgi:CBS domain-containing protein
LQELRLDDHVRRSAEFIRFEAETTGGEILRRAIPGQSVYPVLAGDGRLLGLITNREVERLEGETDSAALAADLMRRPFAVRFDDDLRGAFELMRAEDLPEVPVCDEAGRVVGFVDEVSVARAFLRASSPEPLSGS